VGHRPEPPSAAAGNARVGTSAEGVLTRPPETQGIPDRVGKAQTPCDSGQPARSLRCMIEAYLETADGSWFVPTEYSRGPWMVGACHAGPPTALMARALESIAREKRLTRVTVEIMRPIPMSGFRVLASMRKQGRSVTLTEAELYDEDAVYARAYGIHLRTVEHLEVTTAEVEAPKLSAAAPGPFPVPITAHGMTYFGDSVECRYDPPRSQAGGGPTTMWMRTTVPLLAGEEPSPFQSICPLADSLNGISYNSLDGLSFVNPDLTLSLHRDPMGEWFCAQAISHWEPSGIGLADAALFDHQGSVGRATQNLLLSPAGEEPRSTESAPGTDGITPAHRGTNNNRRG